MSFASGIPREYGKGSSKKAWRKTRIQKQVERLRTHLTLGHGGGWGGRGQRRLREIHGSAGRGAAIGPGPQEVEEVVADDVCGRRKKTYRRT